jgi:hypothetical protein
MRIYEQDVIVAVISGNPSLLEVLDVIQEVIPEGVVTCRV